MSKSRIKENVEKNMLLNYIKENSILITKIKVLFFTFGLCVCLLMIITSTKTESNKQAYNNKRRNLYLGLVITLLALYVFTLILRYTNCVSLFVEYIDIIIYAIQTAITYEVIIQIPVTIKNLQDGLSDAKEQLKDLSIKDLLLICILDMRLYRVNNRQNKFCIIYGEREDKLIRQIKQSGISWQMPKRNLCKNTQRSIYDFRVKNGYTTEYMKNKISYLYLRINPKLIGNYLKHVLVMPEV